MSPSASSQGVPVHPAPIRLVIRLPNSSKPKREAPSNGQDANYVPTNDPTSLSNKSAKPSADVFVAMAQIKEQEGETGEAEKLYQRALRANSKSLDALVGYAHLEDRLGKFEQATRFYKKAIAKHPHEAGVYNDLALCYHRHGMLEDWEKSFRKAIQLQPDRTLYRNNLAKVLVDKGQTEDGLQELLAANGPADAHYNMGCLLHQKGDDATALYHFRQASTREPTMVAARQWIAKLDPGYAPAGMQDRVATRPDGS